MGRRRASLVGGVLCGAVLLGGGCLTTTCLSSPVALEPGQFAWTVGGTSYVGVEGTLPILGLRVGVLPGADIGATQDGFNTRLDLRYQYLSTKGGMPIDMDAEIGAGVLVVLPFYYVGIGIGKDLGQFAPYVRYRYASVEYDDKDVQDEDAFDDFVLGIWWAQATVGTEIRLGPGLMVVAEYSWILGVEDKTEGQLSSVSVAVRF